MFCSRKAPSCGSPRATENYWCSMRPSCFFAKKNNCYVKYEHEDDAAAPVRVHVAEVALGKQSLFAISRRGGFSYYCPSPRFPAARPARLPSSGAPSTLLLSPRRFAAAPYTPFVRVVSALAYARSPRRPARSLLEHKKPEMTGSPRTARPLGMQYRAARRGPVRAILLPSAPLAR